MHTLQELTEEVPRVKRKECFNTDKSDVWNRLKKLKKMHCKLNIRKYSFANRIIDTWNSLPNEVIATKTVKQFEISLDKHWEHQEVKYDYTANISQQSKPGSHGKTKINMEEIKADIVAEQASVH